MGLFQIFRDDLLNKQVHLHDAFFKLDKDNCFEYISHSLRQLLLATEKESLIGKNIWKAFPSLTLTQFYQLTVDANQKGTSASFEYYFKSILKWYRIQIEPCESGLECFFSDITPLKTVHFHQDFLDQVNNVFTTSLEYEITLEAFSRLCVQSLCQWCIIDLVMDGKLHRVSVANRENKTELKEKIKSLQHTCLNDDHPLFKPLNEGESVWLRYVDENMISSFYEDQALINLIKELNPCSIISVPLIVRKEIIGTLTLLQDNDFQLFEKSHLLLAQEIAHKAALHIDNSQLYTQLKASNIKLNESRQRLYNLIMDTPAIICLLEGKDHRMELANPTFQKLFNLQGVSKNTPLHELHIPEDREEIFSMLDGVYQSGEKYNGKSFPIHFKNPNGQAYIRYFDFNYQPAYGENGQVTGVLMFGIEITDQVNARLLLEKGKDRMMNVLENIPHATWTALPDGTLDFYNLETTQRYHKVAELWQDLVHPEDQTSSLLILQHALSNHESIEIEHRVRQSPRHEYHWHITRATFIRNAQQKPILWVGTSTDIHEQKQALYKLERIRQELDSSNSLLTSQNKDLERINSDLDNFVYAASHDLKTPVSNLQGLTNLLREGLEKEGITNQRLFTALRMMDRSMVKFKNTLQDLSDITKLNRDVYEDVDVQDIHIIIDEVNKMIQDMIKKTKAKILVKIAPYHQLLFSRANLKSLIYNLLSNAVKYRHPDKDPVIEITTERNNHDWVLCIKDNGMGIEPKYQDKIFSMFKRLNTDIEGTGMGLFLVKRIVDKSNGKISLESEPQKGSTFKIFFDKKLNYID